MPQQLGAALGVAVLSSVISITGTTRLTMAGAVVPNLAAYHMAFLAAAALELMTAFFALTVRDKDAAVTLRRSAKPGTEPVPEDT